MGDARTDMISGRLSQIVGPDQVIDDPAGRAFFSTDLASRGIMTGAVVKVTSTEELSKVVALSASLGLTVIPRGGGFSYTGGYTPVQPDSIIVDMRGLNRIFEINTEDMYVRVGSGCTWRDLYEALKARGYRTPYFGPMSGFGATIGGALSQGSFFLGSTEYGTVMESVLSLEVVLANGDVIHTGSDSEAGVGPFYRNYGPDLTGLFLADTGALGFKAVATLKLIQFPPHQAYGSFAFDTGAQAMAALSDIARAGLAAEAYAWDPYFVEVMAGASTGIVQDAAFLWNIIRSSAGVIDGLAAALRIALSGKKVFKRGTHIVQITIDDHSAEGAAARLKRVRVLARHHNATELAPSVPRALRGTPFTDFNVPERRTPVRNVPTNSLYPHSRAPAALAGIRRLFDHNKAKMERLGMSVGMVFFAVGKTSMCIEPLVYWTDPEHFLHDRVTQKSDLAGLSEYQDRPEATKFAFALREQLKAVMKSHGAIHVQIGKAYDFLPTREPRVAALLRDLKASLDPAGRVNPGSLGL